MVGLDYVEQGCWSGQVRAGASGSAQQSIGPARAEAKPLC